MCFTSVNVYTFSVDTYIHIICSKVRNSYKTFTSIEDDNKRFLNGIY